MDKFKAARPLLHEMKETPPSKLVNESFTWQSRASERWRWDAMPSAAVPGPWRLPHAAQWTVRRRMDGYPRKRPRDDPEGLYRL